MSMKRATALAAVMVALSLCGCAGGADSSGALGGDQNRAGQASADPQTGERLTIRKSQLRENAIELLTKEATGSEWAAVRANAIEALAAAPSRLRPVMPLALDDPNLGVRSVALMAMGKLRMCDMADFAQDLLEDRSPFVRASAVYALHRCDRDQTPEPLAAMLFASEDPKVRAHAAFLIGELGDRSAAPMLRQAAAARAPQRARDIEARLMQLQIAEALTKLGDTSQLHTIQASLFVSRPEELEATALAVQILGELRARASENDIRNLIAYRDESNRPMPPEIRLSAALALAKLGRPEAVGVGRELMRHDDAQVRALAAMVLGEAGLEEDLAALERLLEDENGLVRVSAAGGILNSLGSSFRD
ncbi:MAG: HEAT repeat domain-containing protein [Phycisphaerales bacterium]|nr:HEAT repeat domain-containing protein [Phycisphaerales bacterium]